MWVFGRVVGFVGISVLVNISIGKTNMGENGRGKTAGVVVLQREGSNKLLSYALNYAAANVCVVAIFKQLMEMRRNCREK